MASTTAEKMERIRANISKSIDEILKDLSTIHKEISDFMVEYSSTHRINPSGYTSRADCRAKEDEKVTEYAKKFKSALQGAKNAENMIKLQKCFVYWTEQVAPVVEKKHDDSFLAIPMKLAALFFFYGDSYKALCCLKSALVLQPYNVEIRCTFMRWTVYLAETEMLKDFLASEAERVVKYKLKDPLKQQIEDLNRVCTAYLDFYRNVDKEQSTKIIMDEIAKLDAEKQYTFISTELNALLRFMAAQFAKTREPSTATPDILHSLTKFFDKCLLLVKSRLPGVFSGDARLKLAPLREPTPCLEILVNVAEYFDAVRDAAIEHFNMGLVRDALSFSESGLKLAYKLGCFPRAVEFANLSLLFLTETSTDSASMSVAAARTRIHILTSGETKESTIKMPESPSRTTSAAAKKLMESFEELKITEEVKAPQRLHGVQCKTACDVCTMYHNSWSFGIVYNMTIVLFHGISDSAISRLDQEFKGIRERSALPLQQKVLGRKDRMRPPIWMCEVYCLCVVRWLRQSDLSADSGITVDAAKRQKRKEILDFAIKVAAYSPIRFLGYTLTLRQFKRYDALGEVSLPYSWMGPPSSSSAEEPKEEVLKLKPPSASTVEKAATEARSDYQKYSHLHYRDWRFPVCSFSARHSSDRWQSAQMWSETTAISTRQQLRNVSGRLDAVSFSRSTTFRAMIERLPEDYTVVQLLADEFGHIWLVKLFSQRDPIIIPICHRKKVLRVRQKMIALIKANDSSDAVSKSTTPAQYWTKRRDLDKQLKDLINAVQLSLFRSLAPFLLPSHPLGPKGRQLAAEILALVKGDGGEKEKQGYANFDLSMAEELVSLVAQIPRASRWHDLVATVGEYCNLAPEKIKVLQKEYTKLRKKVATKGYINQHSTLFTFLVITPILAAVPFELMEIYEERPHVARIVSVHALLKQVTEAQSLPRRIDVNNSFYIVDPDNSLKDTQKRMKAFLEELNLSGVVGKAPQSSDVKAILQEKDIYFYLGHGSGSRHIARTTIQESKCNAVAVLMGCSSVSLDYDGWALDGKCTAYDYTIARAPAVVGCLWMVTDGEIDRYFMALVRSCFSSDANTTFDGDGTQRLRNLMDAMRKARTQAKLPYLTGGAVVCFGLPVTSLETPVMSLD